MRLCCFHLFDSKSAHTCALSLPLARPQVFNAGNLPEYEALCTRYAAQLNAQPALVAHERRLREKITLMALLELISSLPAGAPGKA